ncbi:MAG: hypothetical protein A2508_09955 [Candidatus Lambdaproteobacteria bacterium RIFOXYD12_FULL_49_8]|nr:MAG: hypothetical protein A2508_09955 [Candidatus Lambdaproteobacteria bacterium RIFOXYD12_FULL_49_8]
MRRQIISRLDQEQRTWLFKAIGRIIMADKKVDINEQAELFDALSLIADEHQIADAKRVLASADFLAKFTPMQHIPRDKAWDIFSELIRTAVSDAELAQEELDLLNQIMDALGFKKEARAALFSWVEKMVNLRSEELAFARRLDLYIER